MSKGMLLSESFHLRLTLATLLENMDLKLLCTEQRYFKGKKSTMIKVAGLSKSMNKYIIKDFMIMSFDANTVANVVKKNWY